MALDPLGTVPLGQADTGRAYILNGPTYNPLQQAQAVNAYEDEVADQKAAQAAKAKDQALKAAKLQEWNPQLDYNPHHLPFFSKGMDDYYKWRANEMASGTDFADYANPENAQKIAMDANLRRNYELTQRASKQFWDEGKALLNQIDADPTKYKPEYKKAINDFLALPVEEQIKQGLPKPAAYFDLTGFAKEWKPQADKTATAGPSGGYLWESSTEFVSPEKAMEQATSALQDGQYREFIDEQWGKLSPDEQKRIAVDAQKNKVNPLQQFSYETLSPSWEYQKQEKNVSQESGGAGSQEVENASKWLSDFYATVSGNENMFGEDVVRREIDGVPAMISNRYNGKVIGKVEKGTDANGKPIYEDVIVTGIAVDKPNKRYKFLTNAPSYKSDWKPAEGSHSDAISLGKNYGITEKAIATDLNKKGVEIKEGLYTPNIHEKYATGERREAQKAEYQQAKSNFDASIENAKTSGDAQKAVDEMLAVSPGGIVSPSGQKYINPTDVKTQRNDDGTWFISFKENGNFKSFDNVSNDQLKGIFPAPKGVQPNAQTPKGNVR